MGSQVVRCTAVACLMVTAWSLFAEACAAEEPAVPSDLELGEILISGARPNRDPQQIVEWIRRLIGQFRYSGFVESNDSTSVGGRRAVRGLGECKPFGFSPAVMCEMNVTWPAVRGPDGTELAGGKSTLRPGVFVLGLDPDRLGVRFLEVDNRGMGNGGRGYLRGDSVVTTTPCVDLPAQCQRITRIHAQPDGKQVRMQFDIEQNSVLIARFDFSMSKLESGP